VQKASSASEQMTLPFDEHKPDLVHRMLADFKELLMSDDETRKKMASLLAQLLEKL
jgi:hypothetical protein